MTEEMKKLLNEFEIQLKKVNELADKIYDEATDMKQELDIANEKYDDYVEFVRENYKPINDYELLGMNEKDF